MRPHADSALRFKSLPQDAEQFAPITPVEVAVDVVVVVVAA